MRAKQILTLVLSLVLCISLLPACGGTESPTQTTAATQTPTEATTQATTAPETAPPETIPPETTEATEPAENVNLLAENQRKINLFLSNFAEAYFQEYPCNEYNMLYFGYTHSVINNPKKVKYDADEDCDYIKKKDMDTVLKDYFDKTVKPKDNYVVYYDDNSVDFDVTFVDDRYQYWVADGESYDYMAVAKAMIDNGDGTYTVSFEIYNATNGLKSSYYDFTAEQAAKSSKLKRTERGTAVVKEHTRSNGKKSYALIKYTLK